MIALLRGQIAALASGSLVLDVNGVGYKVRATSRLLTELVGADGEQVLHVSTLVREDAFDLFGFRSAEERDVFDVLRSVNKVGPKVALALLSTLPVDALAQAVGRDDVSALSKTPGVGKRTAERLCLELKNKLPALAFSPSAGGAPGSAPPARPRSGDPLPLALARLDYRKSEIDLVLAHDDVPALGEAPVEERLRAALRVLAPSG